LSEVRRIKSEPKCLILSGRLPGGTAAVLKIYRHRGLASALRGRMFGFRAEREHAALKRMERHGIPCSRPLYWRRGQDRAHGFFETLATREIPQATPLDAYLKAGAGMPAAIDVKPLFGAVSRMHRHGIYHGALSPKNILIEFAGGAPRLFLIDLARSKLFSGSIRGRRIARYDLIQLVVKLERHLGTGACRADLGAYGLDPQAADALYAEARGWGRLRRSHKQAQAALALGVFLAATAARLAGALRFGAGGRAG
jgi:hypothetical protein